MRNQPVLSQYGWPAGGLSLVSFLFLADAGHFSLRSQAEGMWQKGPAYKGLSPNIKDLNSVDPHVIERATVVQELPVQVRFAMNRRKSVHVPIHVCTCQVRKGLKMCRE